MQIPIRLESPTLRCYNMMFKLDHALRNLYSARLGERVQYI